MLIAYFWSIFKRKKKRKLKIPIYLSGFSGGVMEGGQNYTRCALHAFVLGWV